MSLIKDNMHDFGLFFLRVAAGAGIAYHGYGNTDQAAAEERV